MHLYPITKAYKKRKHTHIKVNKIKEWDFKKILYVINNSFNCMFVAARRSTNINHNVINEAWGILHKLVPHNKSIGILSKAAYCEMLPTDFFFTPPSPPMHAPIDDKKRKHNCLSQPNNALGSKTTIVPKTTLHIGSINIGGAIESKIPHINRKIQKFDVIALIETHTFKEDYTWLQTSFPGYIVFCEGKSKNEIYKEYRKNKEQAASLIPNTNDSEKALASINEYHAKYPGGTVVLVKKSLEGVFSISNIVPDKSGVSLQCASGYMKKLTYLHFVYAPCKHDAAVDFWQSFHSNITKHSEHYHYIIGDLNVHMTASDSHAQTPKTYPYFDAICNQLSLVDLWAHHNKDANTPSIPTYVKILQNGSSILSRIDYFLGPVEELYKVQACSAWLFDPILSADHCMIYISINLLMHQPKTPIITHPNKTKHITISTNKKDEKRVAFCNAVELALQDNDWKTLLSLNWTAPMVEIVYNKLEQLIMQAATAHLTIKLKQMGKNKRKFADNGTLQHLHKCIRILTGAVLCTSYAAQHYMNPRALAKVYKLCDTEYYPGQ